LITVKKSSFDIISCACDLNLHISCQMESGKSLVKVEGEEPQGSGEQGEAMEVRNNTYFEIVF
jgi:hypothetical protein